MKGRQRYERLIKTLILLILVVLLLASCGDQPKQLRLESKSRVVVLAPDDPSESLQFALDDLAFYLEQALKVTVVRNPAARPDRTTEGPPTSAATIVVTSSEERVTLPDSLRGVIPGWEVQTLGDEGALIQVRTDGGKPTVLLAGKTTAGACYAFTLFWKTSWGVGFFIDGDRGPAAGGTGADREKRTEIPASPDPGPFYHSVWKAPHANNWRLWGFEEWKQFIDWMRHRRMNVLRCSMTTADICGETSSFENSPKWSGTPKL